MKKSVLVTGLTGQVGSAVARALADICNVATSAQSASCDQPIDLADEASIRRGIQHVKPNIVVNCGAYTQVDKAERDEERAFLINRDAPRIIAEELQKSGGQLIHFSTDYVFDGSGDTPRKESDPVGPINIYGKSKLAGEHAIQQVGGAHIILRTSWVYSDTGHNFVNTMLRLGKEREEISVVSDQIGAPTSAYELADTIRSLVMDGALSAGRIPSGVYHCCNQGTTSWHGFAMEIFAQARAHQIPLAVNSVKAITTADYPTPAARPRNSRLDCSKLAGLLGHPLRTWQPPLEKVIAKIADKIKNAKG